MKLLMWLVLPGLMAQTAAGNFPAVMAESNLEKRSELALREADKAITAAKTAYESQNVTDFKARVSDVEALVQLSYKSLQDTGKRARRSPKYFKRAEMGIRALLRRLVSLENDISVDDKPIVEAARKELSSVHETVLEDIMTKK
jgi:hypothetical protein